MYTYNFFLFLIHGIIHDIAKTHMGCLLIIEAACFKAFIIYKKERFGGGYFECFFFLFRYVVSLRLG